MIHVNGDPIEVTKFPDGTSQVWKLRPEQLSLNSRVYWRFESEAEVMHLAQLAALFAESGIRASLEIRYLPYARQDKAIANDRTFALRPFAQILNAMGWSAVTIRDPHSTEALRLISRSAAVYYVAEAAAAFAECGCDTVCFPDAGALSKYATMFDAFRVVHAEKVRDQATGAITGTKLHGDVHGARVLIVDDICDGGATFIALCRALLEAGAVFVGLFVSHGLFSKGISPLLESRIERIFTPEGEFK